MARHAVFVVAALTFATASPHGQGKESPDALAKALQARYQSVRDFSADFTQTYRAGVLKTKTQESGTVAIKKPGKMRWTYSKPQRKELVSDGSTIHWYDPEARQVERWDVPDQATTPDLFLSGKGDIVRDFTASHAEGSIAGTAALKLIPRRAEPEYEFLVVSFEPVSMRIRALMHRDHQGGESTLVFTNIKENRGLSDRDFVFKVPSGVKVVTSAER
jgi:outer membrane lipoprotein carrier protein